MSTALSDTPLSVAVLISGAGSNMVSLIERGQQPDSPYRVDLVISNIEEATGLEKARALGVETLCLPHRAYGPDRKAHEVALDHHLTQRGIQAVALAGYMRLLTPWLVQKWAGRMLNIHPSLLPLYPGLDTHARALSAKEEEAGCTVHLVTEGMDEGPILGQARVPIYPGDTPVQLAERVKKAEHQLYPQTLRDFAAKLIS